MSATGFPMATELRAELANKVAERVLTEGRLTMDQAAKQIGGFVHVEATASPTANDDVNDGYQVGSLWLELDAHKLWWCEDNTATAAVWKYVSGS